MNNLEKLLRELRLMKDQPNYRYYAAFGLVLLAMLRHPFLSAAVAAFLLWYQHR